jgi:lipopolysaccharide/colanic/teichoic acid biosynthesis glycosyltransferase
MYFEFFYEKLGMIIVFLGLIIALFLFSNAYMNKLFFNLKESDLNNIKIKKPAKTYLVSKRIFDITTGFISLLLFSPLLIICYILIKLFIKGNPIQKVKIKDSFTNHSFNKYFFRTISADVESSIDRSKDKSIKIGKLGKFLRIYSLSELPICFNIIKGDLSFTGRSYFPYKEFFKEDYTTIPQYQIDILKDYPIGLISLWQLSIHKKDFYFGCSAIFKYDLKYISKASFLFDVNMCIKSVFIFLGSKASI